MSQLWRLASYQAGRSGPGETIDPSVDVNARICVRPAAFSHSEIVRSAACSAALVQPQPLGVNESTEERASVGCCVRST